MRDDRQVLTAIAQRLANSHTRLLTEISPHPVPPPLAGKGMGGGDTGT
jgi:hypothetical protein